MPYIARQRRERFLAGLSSLRTEIKKSRAGGLYSFEAGDIAYLVYALLIEAAGKPVRSFGEANAMLGAVRQAAREYERRHLHTYEDDKRHENGDVE